MKPFQTLSFALAFLVSSLSTRADAAEDVKSATRKLAAAANYSWTVTTEIEGAQWTPVPVQGKAMRGGAAILTSERNGTQRTAILHGNQGLVRTDNGWKTAEELRSAGGGAAGGGARSVMRAAALLRTPLPAATLTKLADKTQNLKSGETGVITGELSDEGAKEFAGMGSGGRPDGQNSPEPKNPKGSVRFWLKDGQVQRVSLRISATLGFDGDDRDMVRTTTWEIRDVGTTTVEVPTEAKKRLGS